MCPRLRVVETLPRGKVSDVRLSSPHEEINAALNDAQIVCSNGRHNVLKLPATSPHTTGSHEVWWLNEKHNSEPIYWDTASEFSVFSNECLWQTLHEHILKTQRTQISNPRAYMYWGFTLKEYGFNLPKNYQEKMVWRGLQSQLRLHWHLSEAIPRDISHDWLDSDDPANTHIFARFLNLSGEAMIQKLNKYFNSFGEKFLYKQPVPQDWPIATYDRTFFAFPDLISATKASAELRLKIESSWHALALAISELTPTPFAGQLYELLQSSVPNFVFIVPNIEDRKTADREMYATEVWVVPFSVVGAPEMLTPLGLQLRRPTAKTKA